MSQNIYNELEFENWIDLKKHISNLNSNWIYRGQNQYDWGLASAIDRVNFSNSLTPQKKQEFEKFSIREIKRNPTLFSDKKVPNTDFQTISLLQHYGLPTRLLDFTLSPYVSVFFAIEKSKSDCAIFIINYHELVDSINILFQGKYNDNSSEINSLKTNGDFSSDEQFKNIFLNDNQRDFVQIVQPFYLFDRIQQQNGVFLCQGNINKSFEENLQQNHEILKKINGHSPFYKLRIRKEWHAEILRDLFQMNISSQSLFPGIYGAINSIKGKFDIFNQDRRTKI